MQRRDISKVLLASAAEAALPAVRANGAAAATDLRKALQSHGCVRIPVGTYQLTGKLQTLVQNNITGDSRHDTILLPSGFPDYVLEVGDGQVGPNAGKIERLRLYGAAGNLGCLHLNTLSHMWRLDDLLFSGGPCPAIVVDNCWDSNYTNIDILGHQTNGNDAANSSAIIFRNGCNNIYCRGLRIEGALSGGIYLDGGPMYIVSGKIDDGFGQPQSAAAITIAASGSLVLEDFYLGGMLNQFHIDVTGALKLGRVILHGGSNMPAAINDHRHWTHVNAVTFPTFSSASGGPAIPALDLGETEFSRSHPSVATETLAAVYSKIHPIRQVRNLTTTANGAVRGNSIIVGTNLRGSHNDLYKHSFLVHNPRGVHRKILTSFAGGNLLLEGTEPVALDGDWSIEYCEDHYTPIRHENILLGPGQDLFTVVSGQVVIASELTYVTNPTDPAYGTTKFKIRGNALTPGRDLAGLFLVDNVTREGYYIEHGMDAQDFIGVIYDRRAVLGTDTDFSIVAGHASSGRAVRPSFTRIVASAVGTAPDLCRGNEFEITARSTGPIAILNPINAEVVAGRRITLTLRNSATSALGEVSWGSAYKLARWTSPAPGTSRSIDFRYNGSYWVEVARTPEDVPD